jgi:hypothetical protein
MGVVAYLIWARYEKVWPFGPKEIREVFVEEKTTFTQSGQIHGMMLDSLFGTGSGAMAVGLARGHHRGNAEGSRHDEPRLLAL